MYDVMRILQPNNLSVKLSLIAIAIHGKLRKPTKFNSISSAAVRDTTEIYHFSHSCCKQTAKASPEIGHPK